MPTDGPSAVLPVFEAYQAARVQIAQALAELAVPPAQRPGADAKLPSAVEEAEYREVVAALENYAPTLVRIVGPLCYDVAPSVQLSSIAALSRLARASDRLAGSVARASLLPHALQLLANPATGKDVRVGAAGLLLQMLREPEARSQAIEAGALTQLVEGFEEAEAEMKAMCLWCFGVVADASAAGAAAVVDAGALRVATLSLGEVQLPVLRIGASVLADVAKHDAELAAAVVGAGALAALGRLLSSRDASVRAHALRALAQVGKWGRESGERLRAEMHPTLVSLVGDRDEAVCQNAATCIREIASYGEREAARLVEAGCLPALLGCLVSGRGSPVPAAMAIGLIGGASETLAAQVVESGAVPVLVQGLRLSQAAHVRVIVADALRALCARAVDAALAVSENGGLLVLQALAAQPDEKQRAAAERALGAIAPQLGAAGVYEPLREMVEQASAAPSTLAPALLALATLFGAAEDAGRHQAHFVAAGHMRQLQEMRESADAELRRAIDALNATFPDGVVAQLQPGYEAALLAQIGNHGPDGNS